MHLPAALSLWACRGPALREVSQSLTPIPSPLGTRSVPGTCNMVARAVNLHSPGDTGTITRWPLPDDPTPAAQLRGKSKPKKNASCSKKTKNKKQKLHHSKNESRENRKEDVSTVEEQ